MQEHFSMLGLPMTDRVTGAHGVVTSICFDLYGCVQALVTPPMKDGKREESYWYDVKRLAVSGERVMDAPIFPEPGLEAGGEDHPTPRHNPIP